MYPRLFEIPEFFGIGPLTIYTYGVMLAAGIELPEIGERAQQKKHNHGRDPAEPDPKIRGDDCADARKRTRHDNGGGCGALPKFIR